MNPFFSYLYLIYLYIYLKKNLRTKIIFQNLIKILRNVIIKRKINDNQVTLKIYHEKIYTT